MPVKRKRLRRRKPTRRDPTCERCGNYGYGYMLHDDIWRSIARGARFLCLWCVEDRLGRELTREDFAPMYAVNQPLTFVLQMGMRLRGRAIA